MCKNLSMFEWLNGNDIYLGFLSTQVERVDYKTRIIPLLHILAYVVLQVTILSFLNFLKGKKYFH